MRRTSFLALLCTLAAPACSAVSDFTFTFRDGGGMDATTGDAGNRDAGDAGGPDDAGPDGGGDAEVDAGADADVDGGVDGGMTCTTTCDDGNPCNGIETCDTTVGACVTGTPVDCSATDACHEAGTCDVTTGACLTGAAIVVDDGDPCNGAEICTSSGGVMMVTHSGPRCDDGIACTQDACDPVTGACTSTPKDNLCAGATEICRVAVPACSSTTCTGTSGCSGGAICYGGFCCPRPTGGCMTVSCTTDVMCSDGVACNGTETCDTVTHTCSSGTPVDCADSLACSIDACIESGGGAHTCRHTPGDGDGDTYPDSMCISSMGSDCNDSDPAVNPSATERCNGVDDNCNGATDEPYTSGTTGLGHVCSAGTGVCVSSGAYVCAPSQLSTTCNAVPGPPGLNELCGNSLDDDCNGSVDEGYPGVGTACTVGVGACMTTGTYVCSTDRLSVVCNTGAGSPGNELCGNGADDNCNGMVDEGFESLGMICTVGIGSCERSGALVCSADKLSLECSGMAGLPGIEVCNGNDDDCNGIIDDGPPETWYRDGDGDGYGDSGSGSGSYQFCPPMTTGWTTRGGDCLDTNNAVNPGRSEVCPNGLDDNCNGLVDECPPSNDNCSAPHSLGVLNANANGSSTMSFSYATIESADCMSASGGRSSGPEVWYSFDVPVGRPPFVLYFDTFGSDFDTMISIRAACGMSPPIGCEDDTPCGPTDSLRSHFAFVVPMVAAGSNHFLLAVHAFSVPGTTVVLNWQALPGAQGFIGPLNTSAGATITRALPLGMTSVDTSTACAAGTNLATANHGEDLYYVMSCPGMTHSLRVDTCLTAPAFNTVLYTRAGGGGSGADLTCNDDDASCAAVGLSATGTTVSGSGIWGVYVDGGSGAVPGSTYTLRTISF